MPLIARLIVLISLVLGGPLWAASSPAYVSERITARLITAENGVAPNAATISAALDVELAEGWKTYWRAPGAVGYPASIDWTGSANLAGSTMLWPTPERFTAFEIENYGYETAVTYPMQLTLDTAGEAVVLSAAVDMLVCAELCVPEQFSLTLVLPQGATIDRAAGARIAEAAAALPRDIAGSDIAVSAASLDLEGDLLSIAIESDTPFRDLSVIPDLGLDAAFGPPEITLASGGREALVELSVLSHPEEVPPLELVISDATRAVVAMPELGGPIAAPGTAGSLIWYALLAFLGGLILNVMPCVLPVLTIKLASVLKAGEQSLTRIRRGFAVSALGVLAFMWALAAMLLAMRAGGASIGWGIQFQNPYFLTLITGIIALFAANLFGAFEITLPQRWNTAMAGSGQGKAGFVEDFSMGALAAVLATPCSAPFLGTAISFALAGSALQVGVIFTALGLGLALPYLMVALWPQSVRALPRPGAWMNVVRAVMGLLLLATALWLLSVLAGVIGWPGAGLLALMLAGIIAVLWFRPRQHRIMTAALALVALGLPAISADPTRTSATQEAMAESYWQGFSPAAIDAALAEGQVVFVDITADWCLTCKANKRLVLDRSEVSAALDQDGVQALVGDWTRPDEVILSYLQKNGRFGIPFNIVYGPAAPEGIALPELLTPEMVLSALREARG